LGVGVGRVGRVVRECHSVGVGVRDGMAVVVDLVAVVEGGELIASWLVRPAVAEGRELAGVLALDAPVAQVPSEALRNKVTEVV
jgi:hypothetical protein